jgi:hypothetical protein
MQTIEDGMIKECLICHLKKVMSKVWQRTRPCWLHGDNNV